MASRKPTIVIVPGIWEGTHPFRHVAATLRQHGYEVDIAPLMSTGQRSPGNATMYDDIAHIREKIEPLILTQGKDVVLVCHSAGGFLGSSAIERLAAKDQQKKGQKGGIRHIVFLAAGIMPEGSQHTQLPFMLDGEFERTPRDPRELFYNDLPDDEAEKWVKELMIQPSQNWDQVQGYCGWRDVSSTYLICDKDLVITKELQRNFAELAGSDIEECDSGHMPQVSQPETVVNVIKKAAEAHAT